ncbi:MULTISPECIES: YybS family protein [Oceanobacillus]|uniref:Membrane protein n=1 Tax=Oceanobacillus indicireducens TaxID=1004261 RepID=A0A917XYE7_9BACI|nr:MULTISPECIES: YybS family protein [Oceanobacillus]GGN57645.1 membrane protein [Oceanobacillus indicireducens]
MNNTKKLTEGALLAGIYLILLFGTLVPFLSTFMMVLLPIPFVIYTSKHGVKPGMLVVVFASLISMILTVIYLPLTLMMGAAGLLIGHAINKERTAYETWAYGTLGFIGGLLFTLAFTQVLLGVNFVQEIETIATDQVDWYISLMEGVGLESGEAVDMEALFIEQIQYFIKLMPAFIAISAVFLAFLTQWISYKLLNRMYNKKLYFPPFRSLKLPTSIIWLYLIVIIASLISSDPNSIMYVGVQNALIILEMLLVIQGFSFIFFFTHYKKWSKVIPILSIVLTILFPLFLLYFVRILGIIDIGLNLRARLQKNK